MSDARPASGWLDDPRSRVEGVVLCGGSSRRMGADKARAVLGGRTLLELAVDRLRAHAERVVLACGAEERYSELGLPLVLDPPALASDAAGRSTGPVAGLCAALEASTAELVIALACDMPRVEDVLILRLLEEARARELDACLFESDGGLEPLCAVYRPSAGAAMRAAIVAGRLRVLAFRDFPRADGRPIRFGSIAERSLGSDLCARDMARNLNHPEELSRERLRAEEGSAA